MRSLHSTNDAKLWFSGNGRMVTTYDWVSDKWEAEEGTGGDYSIFKILLKDDCLAIGRSARYNPRPGTPFLDVRLPGETAWKRFSFEQNLPYWEVHGLAKDANSLWISGPGYVAMLSLPTLEITRTFSVQSKGVKHLIVRGKKLWAAAGHHLYSIDL